MSYSWGAARGDGRHGRAALEAVPATPSRARTIPTATGTDVRAAPPSVEHQRVAAELAQMVDVWQRLLAEHVPDRHGLCRTCTKGGTGLPSTPWPCSIHGIAEMAQRRHDGAAERLSS